jgi:aspartyl-tRNA(Asn)/glutamyl-tRNA(Gln) amidotransferase subunit B
MTHELLGQLAARRETFKDNRLTVGQMGELIDLVQDGVITGQFTPVMSLVGSQLLIYLMNTTTGTSRKLLLRHMLAEPSLTSTTQMAQQLQLTASSSPPCHSTSASARNRPSDELYTLCVEAISALPEEVAAVRKGNKNVLNKIVGRVMKNSRGRADAQRVRVVVEELILAGEGT